MKKIFSNINHHSVKGLLALIMLALLFTACEKEEKAGPITISNVYLEDGDSEVIDRSVTFVRLGQVIRIEGTGFNLLKKVYINGFETYFNPVMTTDNSMVLRVSRNTPIVEADASVRNTIRLANDSYDAQFTVEVRSAAPSITNISHTLPLAGETITVYGTGLLEVSKVVFPGNVEVTSDIVSDIDGEFFTVTVPAGVSDDGGSLFIECANGGAYSPAYFNCKKGVLLNFDGVGAHGYWGDASSMIKPEDLESASIGTGNVSQGTYAAHRPSRVSAFDPGSVRCSEVWTKGNDADDWRGQITPFIPVSTPVDQFAFQFDVYVPQAWAGSGYLKVCLVNAFNGGEWAGNSYNYVPWIVDGEVEAFQTEAWTTVTVPFSDFYAFSDGEEYTWESVLYERENTSYKNFGFYFENDDITLSNVTGVESDGETVLTAASTSVSVYTDNWRIVSLETPAYSDF